MQVLYCIAMVESCQYECMEAARGFECVYLQLCSWANVSMHAWAIGSSMQGVHRSLALLTGSDLILTPLAS